MIIYCRVPNIVANHHYNDIDIRIHFHDYSIQTKYRTHNGYFITLYLNNIDVDYLYESTWVR